MVKSSRSRRAYLVELEVVEQVVELPVLLLLVELEEVLLQTVQGELGLVVDVDLKRLRRVSIGSTCSSGMRCAVEHAQFDMLGQLTLCMNFLHVARMSLDRVAENIITCLW